MNLEKHQKWTRLLQHAMQAEVGILVRSNDSSRARQKFHRIRAEMGDPFLNLLQFRIVDGQQILIFHSSKEEASPE